MSGGYAFPSIKVEIGFQDVPYATPASVTWTDVSAYTESFQTSLGRQHELQQVSPSTATITLSNEPTSRHDTTGGRFSPWNTSSEFYYSGSGLTPGHPVRITAKWQNVSYPIFYGYTKAFVPAYGSSRSTMQLQCYDALALLNLNTLDTGQYEATVEAVPALAYYQLADPAGSGSAADSMGGFAGTAGGQGSVQFGVTPGAIQSDSTTSVVVQQASWLNTPTSSCPSGSVYSVTGWFNGPTQTPDHLLAYYSAQPVALGVTGAGYAAASVGTATITAPTPLPGGWNFLGVTLGASVATLYVNGDPAVSASASVSGNTSSGTITRENYNGQGQYAHIATYDVCLTPAQIAEQYQIANAGYIFQDTGARVEAILNLSGVPTGLQNIDTGVVQCQAVTSPLSTTTAMAYLNTVVNTERGLLYQDTSGVIQFKNRNHVYTASTSTTPQGSFSYATGSVHYLSSGLVPGEDDLDLWNNIPVQRVNGDIMYADDATSQTNYGRRTLTGYTNLLFTNDSDSLDLAQGLLYQYKDPQARVRAITLNSSIVPTTSLPQMLGRQLLDRTTINWLPLDGSTVAFSQQSLIEQITHTVTPEVWTTTFAVTPIGTEQFFILDSATEGVLDTSILGF